MQTEGRTPLLKPRVWILASVAGGIFLVDQTSKLIARRSLATGDFTIIPGVLRLSLATNTGGAFGLFRSGRFFFVVAALILVPVVVIFARRVASTWGAIAGGLVVGGALANLAERIFAPMGRVTDFIELRNWPTFNVADAAVLIGTVLAAILIWRGEPRGGSVPDAPDATDSDSVAETAIATAECETRLGHEELRVTPDASIRSGE